MSLVFTAAFVPQVSIVVRAVEGSVLQPLQVKYSFQKLYVVYVVYVVYFHFGNFWLV